MLRVVIADDEERIRYMVKKLLLSLNLDLEIVGEAASGVEALRLCRLLAPDVITTDIRMPGMDGLTFISEVRKVNDRLLPIILTGYDEKEYLRSALRLCAFDYLLKPLDRDELDQVMRKAASVVEENRRKEQAVQRMKSELSKIASETVNSNQQECRAYYQGDNKIILGALKYLLAHFSDPLTLELVAGVLFINPKYFSQLFKKEMHTGFANFLTRLRMERAVSLIRKYNLKIGEVAGMVGYTDSNYFSKVFKNHTGYTPLEYRVIAVAQGRPEE